MFELAYTYSTVSGRLTQTMSDELRVNASTWQLIHK